MFCLLSYAWFAYGHLRYMRRLCHQLKRLKNIRKQLSKAMPCSIQTRGLLRHGRRRVSDEILAGLEGLARELQIPIVIIAGMTRASERRKGKDGIPHLSDLRHFKTLWRHAAWIGLLYRETFHRQEPDDDAEGDPAHLILYKAQQCGVVDIPFSFHAGRRCFEAVKAQNGSNSADSRCGVNAIGKTAEIN